MCIYNDLFGDVIVTKKDIEFWLSTIPRLQGRQKSAKEYYAKYYDVANKIKLSKINGSFDLLIKEFEDNQFYENQPLEYYATRYAEIWRRKPCPDKYHICIWLDCPIYLKRRAKLKKSFYDSKRYERNKKAALKAAKLII